MNNAELLNLPAGDLRAMYANATDKIEAIKLLVAEEPKPVTCITSGRRVGKTAKLLDELLRENVAHQVRLDEIRKALSIIEQPRMQEASRD